MDTPTLDLVKEELAPALAAETVESVRIEEPAVRPAGSVASQPSEGEINQFNRPISAPKPRELKVEDALHYLDQVTTDDVTRQHSDRNAL